MADEKVIDTQQKTPHKPPDEPENEGAGSGTRPRVFCKVNSKLVVGHVEMKFKPGEIPDASAALIEAAKAQPGNFKVIE